MNLRILIRGVGKLQQSQLSVQALTRLCSIYVFLLASWTDSGHLALVALQGALFAIPYTLIESLVGRPLSADLVPQHWNIDVWARRAASAVILPVGLVAYLSATIALPELHPVDRLLMIAPVLVQLPLEAAFWAMARTGSRHHANLVPQLTSAGTLVAGVVFAATDLRVDVVWLPAQLGVLLWTLVRRRTAVPADSGQVRPSLWQSLRVGAVYCLAAGIDLSYSVALPSVAGSIAGAPALVVLRAMELAFGPFHVGLSATTREDIVAGRRSRFRTTTRALTVALVIAVSAVVLGSSWVRGLLADDLATVGLVALGYFCGYKIMLMASTWLSTRHMIWAAPRRYLASAIGSRVLAFAGMAVSVVWVRHVTGLFLQLMVTEAVVVCWFVLRIRSGAPAGAHRAGKGRGASPGGPADPVLATATAPGTH
jgi:hypothetical protein